MLVLALDVAISGCRVAVYNTVDGSLIQSGIDTDRGQAEHLVPLIAEVVAQANMNMSDIGRIAVTIGPGSFTGVRIGLATARHLGLALNKPVCGVSTFDALRASYPDKQTLLIIDTKRGDFYGQVGDDAPRIWSAQDVEEYKGEVIKDVLPDMKAIAVITSHMQATDHYDVSTAPEPKYLRGAEVSQPKHKPVVCADFQDL